MGIACLLLKQRYTQVQQDLRRQAELQQRAIQLGQELRKSRCRLLKVEHDKQRAARSHRN